MRSRLKFISQLSLALVLIAGAGLLCLKYYFNPERIRALIVSYVTENLQKEVSLEAAELGLRGFSLKNFKIAETGGFTKGVMLAAENFSVTPDLRSLLHGELKIHAVYAYGLSLNIRKRPAKTNKPAGSHIKTSGSKSNAPERKPAQSLSLAIANITLKNSRLNWVGNTEAESFTLSGMKLTAKSFTANKPFPFETSFTLSLNESGIHEVFTISAKGKLSIGDWSPSKGRLELTHGEILAGKMRCAVSGILENFAEPEAKINLNLKPFSSGDLKPYFPFIPGRILLPGITAVASLKLNSEKLLLRTFSFQAGPAAGNISGVILQTHPVHYKLYADIRTQTPEMSTTEIARKIRAVPRHFKVPFANISARLIASPGVLTLLDSELAAKSLKAKISGKVNYNKSLKAGAKVKFSCGNIKDLQELFPAFKAYELSGSVAANFTLNLSSSVKDIRGTCSFSDIGTVKLGMTRINGSAELAKNQLSLDAAGELYNSPWKLSLSAKNYFNQPLINMSADLDKLEPKTDDYNTVTPVETLLQRIRTRSFSLTAKSRIGAIILPNFKTGETLISCDLKKNSGDIRTLSGSAAFHAANVELIGSENLLENLKKHPIITTLLYPVIALGKAAAMITLKFSDFNTYKFSRLEGAYRFESGIMQIDKSLARGQTMDADFFGSVNLAESIMDLKLIATPKLLISLPVPVGVSVKGPIAAPVISPYPAALLKQPVITDHIEHFLNLFK